ncbi:MAG: hypothetical protein K0S65_3775 [Labilithrix sp.]|nr:hypothetical protein [Labilithrix sp.]
MTAPGPVFIYLHGFASSPSSTKAKAFGVWAERHGVPLDILDLRVPSLEALQVSAMIARTKAAIDAAGGARARVALIGSSLGGLTAARVAAEDPRVAAVFLMAPAFELASRWEARIGSDAWRTWRETGSIEVDAPEPEQGRTTRPKAHVHWGFIEDLSRIDAELGPWPDVRVPTRIVHGRHDDVVDIELSRTWSRDKRHVELVEVDDGHDLGASIPRLLEEADDFFRPFLGR